METLVSLGQLQLPRSQQGLLAGFDPEKAVAIGHLPLLAPHGAGPHQRFRKKTEAILRMLVIGRTV
jgi:hypothetical protein